MRILGGLVLSLTVRDARPIMLRLLIIELDALGGQIDGAATVGA